MRPPTLLASQGNARPAVERHAQIAGKDARNAVEGRPALWPAVEIVCASSLEKLARLASIRAVGKIDAAGTGSPRLPKKVIREYRAARSRIQTRHQDGLSARMVTRD
jgi:hypothetical protein